MARRSEKSSSSIINGKSALALVARESAFSFLLVYGSVKLKILNKSESDSVPIIPAKAKSHKKAEAKAHQ
ncbi:hypothetical protein L6164_024836 [Bauhinia variegata]|uniref:Uncharacterized protein n=1 Tax=Bauhinia variegata TaxID=167791 RepID=A0ACB9LZ24_BAUVA|nr:hypothetical protein L6164_024836 [Bauhinia variegata]